jgi:hypothetical protein
MSEHSHTIDPIQMESHMHPEHEGAIVVSGELSLYHVEYEILRDFLVRAMESCSADISALGGIVGHIKAAVSISETEFFSITDTVTNVKQGKEKEISIRLVGIVFSLSQMQAEQAILKILEGIKNLPSDF